MLLQQLLNSVCQGLARLGRRWKWKNYREVKKAEPCLKLIHMDQVEVEEIEWLFYPFIPYGKVTIIQGDPGEGKTTVVLQIIAKLTKGEAILSETSEGKSEETGVEPINVIYQTAEDGLGDTIKPRLLAAGADCSRVLVIDDQDQPLTMVDVQGWKKRSYRRKQDL